MNGMKIEKAIEILEPYKKSVFGDASEKYGGSISVEEIIELLRELENKKLIDADKLREKLGFAEHCEDCKHDSWKCGRDTIYSLCDFCETIDIAIEELMQEGREVGMSEELKEELKK